MGKKQKDANRPRGRMSAYAYFVQNRRSVQDPTKPVLFTAFSKDCAGRWRGMDDNDKRPFNEKSAADKIRYDREMSSYVPPKGDKKKGRRRQKKDPDAPKRNLSAFFLFSRDERGAIKKANPEFSVGKIAQRLAAMWKVITPADKDKYIAEAAVEKQRYLKDMAQFKASKPKVTKKVRKESSSSSSSDSSSDDSSSDSDSDEE